MREKKSKNEPSSLFSQFNFVLFREEEKNNGRVKGERLKRAEQSSTSDSKRTETKIIAQSLLKMTGFGKPGSSANENEVQ